MSHSLKMVLAGVATLAFGSAAMAQSSNNSSAGNDRSKTADSYGTQVPSGGTSGARNFTYGGDRTALGTNTNTHGATNDTGYEVMPDTNARGSTASGTTIESKGGLSRY